jgi:hypothetical protein
MSIANTVTYTQQNDANSYSVRVGTWQVYMGTNVQYLSEVEASHVKLATCPTNDELSKWIDTGELIGVTGLDAMKNNEKFLRQLLPKNHHGSISDWEIMVIFSSTEYKEMKKTCLRNKNTKEICLVTSWNQKFNCKTIAAVEDGWWVCNTHMQAPASFYAAVINAI